MRNRPEHIPDDAAVWVGVECEGQHSGLSVCVIAASVDDLPARAKQAEVAFITEDFTDWSWLAQKCHEGPRWKHVTVGVGGWEQLDRIAAARRLSRQVPKRMMTVGIMLRVNDDTPCSVLRELWSNDEVSMRDDRGGLLITRLDWTRTDPSDYEGDEVIA